MSERRKLCRRTTQQGKSGKDMYLCNRELTLPMYLYQCIENINGHSITVGNIKEHSITLKNDDHLKDQRTTHHCAIKRILITPSLRKKYKIKFKITQLVQKFHKENYDFISTQFKNINISTTSVTNTTITINININNNTKTT